MNIMLTGVDLREPVTGYHYDVSYKDGTLNINRWTSADVDTFKFEGVVLGQLIDGQLFLLVEDGKGRCFDIKLPKGTECHNFILVPGILYEF